MRPWVFRKNSTLVHHYFHSGTFSSLNISRVSNCGNVLYSVLWVLYCHGFTNVHSQAKCFPYNTNYINYQFQLKNKNLKLILICRKEKILMGQNVCLNPSLLRIRYIAQTYFLVLSNKFFQIIPRLFLQGIPIFF